MSSKIIGSCPERPFALHGDSLWAAACVVPPSDYGDSQGEAG